MKKIILTLVTLSCLAFSSRSQTMMSCEDFCVLSINNLDTTANTIDVTIWNGDSVDVNYPTIIVVDGLGDTVINKPAYFYLFLHPAGDTLTQTIPTDWDSIPVGFTGTVFLTDQVWDSTCSFSYPMSCTVGINEYASASNLLLYPNPADELFNLSMKGMKGAAISVYDLTGRLVRKVTAENDEIIIPRDDLRSGVYFLELNIREKRLTKKVVLK